MADGRSKIKQAMVICLQKSAVNVTLERQSGQVRITEATEEDGADIWSLVKDSGVLDVNSPYSYLMMGKFFSETCLVAKDGDQLVGFVTAFRPPTAKDVIFVWQIGVDLSQRGKGVGKKLLHELLQREAGKGVRFLESTITPSNKPSQALFRGLARDLNTKCQVTEFFSEDLFPGEEHEPELKFRIGPVEL